LGKAMTEEPINPRKFMTVKVLEGLIQHPEDNTVVVYQFEIDERRKMQLIHFLSTMIELFRTIDKANPLED